MENLATPVKDQEKLLALEPIYASIMNAVAGPHEFTLLAAQTRQIRGDAAGVLEDTPAFVYVAAIWMAPSATRDFYLALGDIIEKYEDTYGRITETPFAKAFRARAQRAKRPARAKKSTPLRAKKAT